MWIYKIGRRVALGAPILAGVALALPVVSSPALATKVPAIKPPTASTGGVTLVTGVSATLAGAIDPHGTEASCYFQYGPTAAYGSQTPTTEVGNGTAPVKVSQAISGLQLGTTYYYRLVVVAATGTVADGQGHMFTTKKIPLKFAIAKPLEPVVYGSPFSIEGTLTGTGGGNRQIVLQGSPFPYLGVFTDIGAPALTNAAGGFSFSVTSLPQNTRLRVVTLDVPPLTSPAVIVRVAVRVTLHMRPTRRQGYVRLYGTVTPSVVGAPVTFQLLRPGLAPVGVSGTLVRRGTANTSRFNSVVFIRHGRGGSYRALVRVANGKLVSGYSATVSIRSAPAPARRGRRRRRG